MILGPARGRAGDTLYLPFDVPDGANRVAVRAAATDGASFGVGGGIFSTNSATTRLRHSIVAGNLVDSPPAAEDCRGTVISLFNPLAASSNVIVIV